MESTLPLERGRAPLLRTPYSQKYGVLVKFKPKSRPVRQGGLKKTQGTPSDVRQPNLPLGSLLASNHPSANLTLMQYARTPKASVAVEPLHDIACTCSPSARGWRKSIASHRLVLTSYLRVTRSCSLTLSRKLKQSERNWSPLSSSHLMSPLLSVGLNQVTPAL